MCRSLRHHYANQNVTSGRVATLPVIHRPRRDDSVPRSRKYGAAQVRLGWASASEPAATPSSAPVVGRDMRGLIVTAFTSGDGHVQLAGRQCSLPPARWSRCPGCGECCPAGRRSCDCPAALPLARLLIKCIASGSPKIDAANWMRLFNCAQRKTSRRRWVG